MSKVEWCFKIVVVGDGKVGKTSLIRRFVHNSFVQQYKQTIGAQFIQKDVFITSLNSLVHLMLWDTAGNQQFNVLTQAYYRGSAAAIIAFSATDRQSFCNVINWKNKVQAVCGPITIILCQTKMDLVTDNEVKSTQAEQLAQQLRVPYFRVSTRDNFNVKHLFQFITQLCVEAETQFTAMNTDNLLSINSSGANDTQSVSVLQDVLTRKGNNIQSEQPNKGKNNVTALKAATITKTIATLADVNTHSAFSLTDSAFPTNLPQQSRDDSKQIVHIVPTANSLANAGTSSVDDHQRHQHHHKTPNKNLQSSSQNVEEHKGRIDKCGIDKKIKPEMLQTKKPLVYNIRDTNGQQYGKNGQYWRNRFNDNTYNVNVEKAKNDDKVEDKIEQKKLPSRPPNSQTMQHKMKKKKKKKVKCVLM